MQRKIINTKDNSKTLLIPEMNETYHSTNGAVAESKHIYINYGLNHFINTTETVNILEMGFGTGLNAILTLDYALTHKKKVNYFTIEKYPVTLNEIIELDYANSLDLDYLKSEFLSLHELDFKKDHQINPYFSFSKHHTDLKAITLHENKFQVIYFDAFAPQHQPDLWTLEILQKMYDCLASDGFLITYCAQGQFKRNLKAIGFEIVPLPGPVGKREITKAIKK
jgi:tRNA U34 5-methylaminomethyl-2-thiouridine-forming methyltransferase MnmC